MDDESRRWEEKGLRDAVLRGDEAAWRALYDRCFGPLYAFIELRAGRSRDWTEEVVQETWLVAVRRIRVFDPARASFEGWLRGIARNVLRNHWRQRRRPDGEAVADNPASGAAGGGRDLAERIGLVLTALPERYRSVLLAKYQHGLSVNAIALERGESRKAVESLLTRARSAFRRVWAASAGGDKGA